MSNFIIRTAQERREQIRRDAANMGIKDDYISTLVETFYSRVRTDPELGPIFDGVIGDNWDPHLQRMKDFWASVALNAGRYSGKPVPAHTRLEGVSRGHFSTWLHLFRSTLKDTAPSPEAIDYFMERAERIAESLQFAMFGMPGLQTQDGVPTKSRTIDV
jgi:hemoglobin